MQVSLCWWSVNCCVQACKQTQRDTQGTKRAKCAHVGGTNNTRPTHSGPHGKSALCVQRVDFTSDQCHCHVATQKHPHDRQRFQRGGGSEHLRNTGYKSCTGIWCSDWRLNPLFSDGADFQQSQLGSNSGDTRCHHPNIKTLPFTCPSLSTDRTRMGNVVRLSCRLVLYTIICLMHCTLRSS